MEAFLTQIKFAFKVFSIGAVFLVSCAGAFAVRSIVQDRLDYQASAVKTQGGDVSRVLIHGKLPGFDNNGVSVYRIVDRVLKYAILFIALTFLAFFLTEIVYQLKLHPMQYLLVGLGLAEFYLLLLAFMEHVGFLWAYGIAASMTIVLISSYSRFVLQTFKGSIFIAVLLAIAYSYLLVVLHLEAYALLAGALLLFFILAIAMAITRNIDWYRAFGYTT